MGLNLGTEVGAIPRYLWDVAQVNIKSELQAVSDAQKALNPDYEFIKRQDW